MATNLYFAVLCCAITWRYCDALDNCGDQAYETCCSLESVVCKKKPPVKYNFPCVVCYDDTHFGKDYQFHAVLNMKNSKSIICLKDKTSFTLTNFPWPIVKNFSVCGENESNINFDAADVSCQCPDKQCFDFLELEEISILNHGCMETDLEINAPRLTKVNFYFHAFQHTYFNCETNKAIKEVNIHKSYVDFGDLVERAIPLESLTVFNLSHNKFLFINEVNDTIQLRSVRTLDLSNCEIRNLEGFNFKIFKFLEYLNLTNNAIRVIDPNAFIHFPRIFVINMSCSLDMSSLTLNFDAARTINMIDLSKNNLYQISLNSSSNVRYVNISQNRISKWNDFDYDCEIDVCINNLYMFDNNVTCNIELLEQVHKVEVEDFARKSIIGAGCLIVSIKNKKILKTYESTYNHPRSTEYMHGESAEIRSRRSTNLSYTRNENIARYSRSHNYNYYWVPITLTVLIALLAAASICLYCCDAAFFVRYIKHKLMRNETCSCEDVFEYDAFVTFSVSNREWVWTVLKHHLENLPEKYHLNLFERDHLFSTNDLENIEESMATSAHWIMILTNDFINSQWCQSELQLARNKLAAGKYHFLMLIELEPLDLNNIPPFLKELMSTKTYIDWNIKKFIEASLLNRVKAFLGESFYQKKNKKFIDI